MHYKNRNEIFHSMFLHLWQRCADFYGYGCKYFNKATTMVFKASLFPICFENTLKSFQCFQTTLNEHIQLWTPEFLEGFKCSSLSGAVISPQNTMKALKGNYNKKIKISVILSVTSSHKRTAKNRTRPPTIPGLAEC